MAEESGIFMNLMTDFAFKHLYGTEEHKQILIRFLNILFAEEGLHVRDVVYHNKEVLPEDSDGKRIIYDVYCTNKDGLEHFILEMQQVYHTLFEDRAVFYASKAIALQLKKGGLYRLNPVYSIFLVDFRLRNMDERNMHDVRLMDVGTHEIFSDKMRLLFVHLCEAKESWDECGSELEKLVYIIKNMHKMDRESKAYKSGEFDDMFHASEIGSLAAEDAVLYSQSRLRLQEMRDAVAFASNESFEKGMEEGLEKGMKKGLEEGLEKGMEKGRNEERLSLAKNMLASGYSAEEIERLTGITAEFLR